MLPSEESNPDRRTLDGYLSNLNLRGGGHRTPSSYNVDLCDSTGSHGGYSKRCAAVQIFGPPTGEPCGPLGANGPQWARIALI